MKVHGTKHPLAAHEYVWAIRLDENDQYPIFQTSTYAGLPYNFGSSIAKLTLNPTYDRCFISGVKLMIATEKLYNTKSKYIPWARSTEHLISKYNNTDKNTEYAIVSTGWFINNMLGHTPMTVKLSFRNHLKTIEYDHDDYTGKSGNIEIIFSAYLEYINQFKYKEKYPWQPWMYDPDDQEIVQNYFTNLLKWENEFLSTLTYMNRKERLNNNTKDEDLPSLYICEKPNTA